MRRRAGARRALTGPPRRARGARRRRPPWAAAPPPFRSTRHRLPCNLVNSFSYSGRGRDSGSGSASAPGPRAGGWVGPFGMEGDGRGASLPRALFPVATLKPWRALSRQALATLAFLKQREPKPAGQPPPKQHGCARVAGAAGGALGRQIRGSGVARAAAAGSPAAAGRPWVGGAERAPPRFGEQCIATGRLEAPPPCILDPLCLCVKAPEKWRACQAVGQSRGKELCAAGGESRNERKPA